MTWTLLKLSKVCNVIKLWHMRKLTLEGKITIFRSLAISKTVYFTIIAKVLNIVNNVKIACRYRDVSRLVLRVFNRYGHSKKTVQIFPLQKKYFKLKMVRKSNKHEPSSYEHNKSLLKGIKIYCHTMCYCYCEHFLIKNFQNCNAWLISGYIPELANSLTC